MDISSFAPQTSQFSRPAQAGGASVQRQEQRQVQGQGQGQSAVAAKSTKPRQSAQPALLDMPFGAMIAAEGQVSPDFSQVDTATAGLVNGEVAPSATQLKALARFDRSVEDMLEDLYERFGVSPEAVLSALQNVMGARQAKSPDELAEAFVQTLKLPEEGKASIKNQFLSALDELENSNSNSSSQAFKESKDSSDKSALATGLASAVPLESKEARDSRAADQIQKTFFSNQALPQKEGMPLDSALETNPQFKGDFAARMAGAASLNSAKPPSAERSTLNELQFRNFTAPKIKAMGAGAYKNEMAAGVINQAAAQVVAQPQESDEFGEFFDDGSPFSELSILNNLNAPAGQVAGSGQNSLFASGLSASGLNQAGLSPEDRIENINKIIEQSQYMIKDGGGEMKLQLSPEGLGQVHLKVNIENGQMNVQMLADSAEAKQALTDSLSELRDSLAQHKISVDQISIKLNSDASLDKDSAAQNQNNFNQQQNERSAQQMMAESFMKQHREEREAMREGFSSLRNVTSTNAQRRNVIEPMNLNARSHSGRLNVVA